jgi:site-specific recombinase XerD
VVLGSVVGWQNTMTGPQLTVEEAVNDFLEEKKTEVAESSWRNYRYPLNYLVGFCEQEDIEYVNDLTGYDFKKFKTHRRKDDINNVTLYNNLSVIRVFLQWCEQAQLLDQDFHKLVQLPPIEDGEIASEDKLELEAVEDILSYLYKFEYATRRHATFQLMWHTCIRMGTLMALDVDDYLDERNQLRVRHRPDSGTPLKNKSDGERKINLNDEMCEVLDDYISTHREEITEDNGREPLFTSPSKRLYDTLLRKDMYAITRPCFIGSDCPHDRDPDDCEATMKKQASKCPSSMSAHPLRRSAITYHLNRDIPKEKISGRADVSVSVLDTHYDARTEDERAANRQVVLDKL